MALLTKEVQTKVVQLLIDEGLVDAKQVAEVRSEALQNDEPLLSALTSKRLIDDGVLTHAVAMISNVPYVDLTNIRMSPDVLAFLPKSVAERMMSVPVADLGDRVAMAMIDPGNVQTVDYLTTIVQRPLKIYMASQDSIQSVVDQYGTDMSAVDQAVKSSNLEEEAKEEQRSVQTIVQDSPISKALNTILEYAVRVKASDIHVEPLEKELIIRCRIDGVLREIMRLPKSIEAPLVSRIKIMSNLKIDEHRIPQDGQFAVRVGDAEVDLRIAIAPVVWGEQVVIRLLDKSGASFDLEQMGFAGRALRTIRKGISKPNGMILTSGPTGSGKSTTLYALIKEIKNESINIITLEDPVEYKMDGVNQIQVNLDAGLTFASGLRSILRQDPDVIMVGEIRDAETAGLAVQAALTGHLVFSTLHTNSAAGILPRLLDMGVEPFLLASTLNTVIGQRLVRRVSPKRETYDSSDIETESINSVVGNLLPKTEADVASVSEDLGYERLPLAGQESYQLVRGIDSPETPRGYQGRAGIYEVMDVDDEVEKMIVSHATAGDVQKLALQKGMVSMRQDGTLKVLTGITTLDEVNRVASDIA